MRSHISFAIPSERGLTSSLSRILFIFDLGKTVHWRTFPYHQNATNFYLEMIVRSLERRSHMPKLVLIGFNCAANLSNCK